MSSDKEPRPRPEEQAAVRELERLQQEIELWRGRRKRANEQFEEFLRSSLAAGGMPPAGSAEGGSPVPPASGHTRGTGRVREEPVGGDAVVAEPAKEQPAHGDTFAGSGRTDTTGEEPRGAEQILVHSARPESMNSEPPGAEAVRDVQRNVEPAAEPPLRAGPAHEGPPRHDPAEGERAQGGERRERPVYERPVPGAPAVTLSRGARGTPDSRIVPAALAPAPAATSAGLGRVALAVAVLVVAGVAIAWLARAPLKTPAAQPEPAGAPPPDAAPAGPAAAPAGPAAAPAVPAQEGSEPEVRSTELATTRRVWVRVTVDGHRVLERELPPDSRVPLSAVEDIVIRTGDGGAVRLFIEGQDQGPLGGDGRVVTKSFRVGRSPSR